MPARNYWNPITAIAAVLTLVAFLFASWEEIGSGLTAFADSDWGQLALAVGRLFYILLLNALAFVLVVVIGDRLTRWRLNRLHREAEIIALKIVVATLLEVGDDRGDRFRSGLQKHEEKLLGEHSSVELRNAVGYALLPFSHPGWETQIELGE